MNRGYPHTHYIKKPLPLITPRIEFEASPRPPLPVLTTRIEFNAEELTVAHGSASSDSPVHRRVAFNLPSDEENRPPSVVQTPSRPPTPPSIECATPSPSSHAGGLIPSPKGEPGRPNSGGFSIVDVLVDNYNWTIEEVNSLMDAVDREVVKKLDTTVSFRSQSKERIDQLCQKLQDEAGDWPDLDSYQGCWPVVSMIKLKLKSKSESSRRLRDRTTARRIVAAAGGRLLNP